ncbi:MAG: cob(I)yrinic acid a,c-diamide adenosyltransferase [Alphaproteobacteria bacterium]|nr:cob(I)yrinic acid a,c-diamide adenosyltransferase [Alphaproteobacteria bacterium]
MTATDDDARWAAKKKKQKAARDRMLARKTREKGLLVVHTGTGKGKTTAAMGLVMRALGHGFRVGIVQFVKGKWETGERAILDRFSDLVTIRVMGEGFSWDSQDRQRDIAAARSAWTMARELLADPSYRLIVLDELNIVLRYEHLPVDEVVAVLAARRPGLHVVVTGRNAPEALIEAADTVTVMDARKHHFRADVRAQPGVEF